MSYFVFIISSRNNPIYEQFDIMRRTQMNILGISHKFLRNGTLPEGYEMKDDEEYHEDTSFTPGMFRKFYDACKNLYSTNNIPDFIIRCNSSTFIDFNKFNSEILPTLPKENTFAGPIDNYEGIYPHTFISGMCMIFSKDVLYNLITNIPRDHPLTLEYCDDVAISYIVYTFNNIQPINLLQYTAKCTTFDKFLHHVPELPANGIICRVKNEYSNRYESDIAFWKHILKLD